MAHLQLIPRPSDRVLASPLFSETVAAGFPSPAAGYEENELNLHEYCVKHPAATYFLRVSGSSMVDARIHDGDVLVVDRSLTPEHGSIVIASIDNEFTVKRLILRPKPCLMPMNSEFSPIYFDPDSLQIWGVVTFSIRVLVVLDDAESNHFQFSYEKYLGLEEPSNNDQKHMDAGEETTMDRTRRLFYVSCTRALKDLAVVLFTANPKQAEAHIRQLDLFEDEAIHTQGVFEMT